jgi:trans-2,3-dihydro-3-hydroxyanthranilate isomerase
VTRLPFHWVDAFTTRALGGNPCAVVLDADSLSPEKMQAFAHEMGLSETAFVLKSKKADFRARYFTPEREIPLAGHPTIATIHTLIDAGRIAKSGAGTRISLELEAGVIPVDIRFDSLYPGSPRITMSQLAPKFLRTYDPEIVLSAFGLKKEDVLPALPIQTVSTGSTFLMIPLKNQEALKRMEMDRKRFRALREGSDFFSAHLFCLQGVTADATTFARHPGLPPDTLEDPFTGSATGCMGAYLWKYGLIREPRFVAEQGHWMGRPGQAEVEVVGSSDAIETVRVGGRAVTIIRGETFY